MNPWLKLVVALIAAPGFSFFVVAVSYLKTWVAGG